MTSVLQRMNGAHKTGTDKVAHGCGIQKNIHSIFSVATKGEAMNIIWKRQFRNKDRWAEVKRISALRCA